MPIFVYAFPVTAVAALLLTLAALILDGAGLLVAGQAGVFGWLASDKYAPWVSYEARYNTVLMQCSFKYILVVSTRLCLPIYVLCYDNLQNHGAASTHYIPRLALAHIV
jgi:hypothetical protein